MDFFEPFYILFWSHLIQMTTLLDPQSIQEIRGPGNHLTINVMWSKSKAFFVKVSSRMHQETSMNDFK